MSTLATLPSLAEQFRIEYAKGIVPAMKKSLDNGKKRSKALLILVMAVTYWHVASYLAWHTAFGWFGFAVPLIIDLSMLQMLDILQTRAQRKPARQFATWMAAVLGLISGTFNVIAADDLFTAFGYASLVLVAIATKVAVSLMGPDFEAFEAAEQDASKADAEAAIQVRIDEAVKKARRSWTASLARKRRHVEEISPVSPGVDGDFDPAEGYAPAYAHQAYS